MPWSYNPGGNAKKGGRKKSQARKPSYRPRGIGRSLVDAEIREMLKEHDEAQKRKKAAETEDQAASSKSHPPVPLVSPDNSAALEAAPKSFSRKTPEVDGTAAPTKAAAPPSIAKVAAPKPAAVNTTKKIPDTASSLLDSNASTNHSPQAASLSTDTNARIAAFKKFLSDFPIPTQEWKVANKLSSKNAPPKPGQHFENSAVVFSFKRIEYEGDDNDSLILGATLYDRDHRKLLSKASSAVMHVKKKTGVVVFRWTDWIDSRASTHHSNKHSSMFVWLVRTFFLTCPLNVIPRDFVAVRDEAHLRVLDQAHDKGLHSSKSYYVFEENASFPMNSGW